MTLELDWCPNAGNGETIGFKKTAPGKPRVLVVEDEPLISMLIEEMLTELGYAVIGPAATVSDALAAVEANHNISCALLDFQLKGERTLAVADLLINRHIPFAFVTGNVEQLPTGQCGAVGVVEKPFTEAQIAGLLTALSPTI